MSQRILYNFASRSRPVAFFKVLDNIREMSASDNYEICAKLDEDDPQLPEYRAGLNTYHTYISFAVHVGQSNSKIHAINRHIVPGKSFDIIINISDDQRFTVKGFDNVIREHCKPDSFAHFPESYKKAACSVMSIMHRDYFNMTGLVYNPAYYSLWCDTEATEVAKLLGCYVYVPQTIFEHLHYSNTGIEKDELYKRNNTYKKDQRVYLERRENNFDLPFPRTPYLLINFATRGRWRQFFAAIDNIHATIRTNQFKILVKADFSDVEMNSPEVRQWVRRYPNVELHYGDHESKVDAINSFFNPQTKWSWMINMSDDFRFVEYGWDYKMLEDLAGAGVSGWDWFGHWDDGFVGDKLPTMSIMGRNFYNRFGYVYHPAYKSVSCDAEAKYVSMMMGKYHYFDKIYFHHMHPANMKEPSDATYRRNHEYGKQDTITYFERLKRYFDVKEPIFIPEEMKPFL